MIFMCIPILSVVRNYYYVPPRHEKFLLYACCLDTRNYYYMCAALAREIIMCAALAREIIMCAASAREIIMCAASARKIIIVCAFFMGTQMVEVLCFLLP